MNQRIATHVADTSYLICFGGVAQGLDHLRSLFDTGLSAPPVVKYELVRIARHSNKDPGVKAAAELFVGRQSGILMDIPLEHADVTERDLAIAHLSDKALPPAGESSTSDTGAPSESDEPYPTSLRVDNGGEAEAIAICVRTELPLLMNDRGATTYAQNRSVLVEPAVESLRRFLVDGSKTPKQLFQIVKAMERVGYPGAIVPGPQWFRRPDGKGENRSIPGKNLTPSTEPE